MTEKINKDVFIKGKNDLPVAVTINKGEIVNRNYTRVVNLSKNEKIYSQGEGLIRISPFDNYYLFTIYSELNLEDVPVDLNNMGDFYLVFKDKKTEVRIKNYTNTKDINTSAGQILFKISQEDAEKILSLSTDIFYVTSAIITNDSKSDETVIYSGKFAEFNKASNDSLSDTINELREELKELNSNFNSEKAQMQATINELNDLVAKLQNNNTNISEQLSSYKKMCDTLSAQVTADIRAMVQQQAQQTKVDNEPKARNSTNLSAFTELQMTSVLPAAPNITKSNSSTSESSNEPLTEAEAKSILGNIAIKNGKVQVLGYVTATKEKTGGGVTDEYMIYKFLIKYIQDILNGNKNNNIVCMFMDKALDKGKTKFSTLYKITTNSIVVSKSPTEVWGTINLTKKYNDNAANIDFSSTEAATRTARNLIFDIEKDLINIIKSNNN